MTEMGRFLPLSAKIQPGAAQRQLRAKSRLNVADTPTFYSPNLLTSKEIVFTKY